MSLGAVAVFVAAIRRIRSVSPVALHPALAGVPPGAQQEATGMGPNPLLEPKYPART